MDAKRVGIVGHGFNMKDILKTIEQMKTINFITQMKMNYITYLKIKNSVTTTDEFNNEGTLYGVRFDIDETVSNDVVKVVYNNGDEKEIIAIK